MSNTPDNMGSQNGGLSSENRLAPKKNVGGRPKGPSKATLEREAYLRSLIEDDLEEKVLGALSPLDVIYLAIRKLLAAGHYVDAAELAVKAAPYRHGKIATVIVKTGSDDDIWRMIANDPDPPLLDIGKKDLP